MPFGHLSAPTGAGGAFGVWIFTAWRRPLLATLAPLGGSYLVVTGLGFLLSRGLSVPLLPPQDAPWAAGAKVLLGPLGRDACSQAGVELRLKRNMRKHLEAPLAA